MKIEKTTVVGLEWIVDQMRNPLESWNRCDSTLGDDDSLVLGASDKDLLLRLCKAGSPHRKVLRSVHVYSTFTLPLYVWTELDTYKVGTNRHSCSTMHTLGKRELGPKDFQDEVVLPAVLEELNNLGEGYRKTKGFRFRERMKQHLPSGFLLKAGYEANYEAYINMLHQRKDHRLKEWAYTGQANSESICNWITTLPYMYDILVHIGEIKP
jgi:hypothetical protein